MPMIRIALHGANELRRELDHISKQIPFATAVALTRTAQKVSVALREDMASSFDRPTRWTLNSLRVESAKKDKLRALVAVKDKAARGTPALRWIAPAVDGGKRLNKPSERAMQAMGALPGGYQVVIGKSTKTNKHGNLTARRVKDAIEGARASMSGGSQGQRYFLMRRGSTPIGIAQRTSKRNMHIVLAFIPQPSYDTLFDFYGVGRKEANKAFPVEMKKSLEHALRTARRKS